MWMVQREMKAGVQIGVNNPARERTAGRELRGPQGMKSENLKVPGIRREHSSHTRGPEDGRELRVENPFAPQLMALHPIQEQDGGVVGGENVLHFGGVPPEAGLGHRLVRRQRFLKAARVGDDMDEFGKDLGREGERDLRLQNLALQKFVSGLMRGQLDEFELNQKSGVRPDHCRASSISPRGSSSGDGKGRSTAPTDFGSSWRKDVCAVTGESLATGLSASVITSSPSRARSRTSSCRCFCASVSVTVCMAGLSHKPGSMPTVQLDDGFESPSRTKTETLIPHSLRMRKSGLENVL